MFAVVIVDTVDSPLQQSVRPFWMLHPAGWHRTACIHKAQLPVDPPGSDEI